MAFNSKIEWTNHTANLWHGCSKVTPGCDNCYAEALTRRWGRDVWGNDKPRLEIKSVWNDFKKMQKEAKAADRVDRVFVGSMMDIFEKPIPVIDSKGREIFDYDFVNPAVNTQILRQRFFEQVVPNSPNLLFLLLTKRPSNINKIIPEEWKTEPPQNVMFGTSPCDQETANKLIGQLLEVNGYKFLSVEPMLGPVHLYESLKNHLKVENKGSTVSVFVPIHWVICGGESGHGARDLKESWAIDLRAECKFVGIPFFFKQGSAKNWTDFKNFESFPEILKVREFPQLPILQKPVPAQC